MSGDTGLIAYEKAVAESPEGKAAYSERMAQQNAARQNAIGNIQPSGAVADLPEAVRSNADAAQFTANQSVAAAQNQAKANEGVVDAATQAHLDAAQQAQTAALAKVQALKPDASPLETANHFRSVRDALEQGGTENVAQAQDAAAQARQASAPVGQNPEQIGTALRAPAQAASDAASAATSKLYDSLPKDMVAPSSEIAAKAKAIQDGQLPEHSPITGEEARLYGLAANYGPTTPLANVNALRSSLLSARAALRGTDPQAWGRLGQLQKAVEDSVDHAVENRAALDQIAVRRGNIAASDALPARLQRMAEAENAWRTATTVATDSGRPSIGAGRSEGGDAGGVRGGGEANLGSGNAAGGEGLSPVSGGTPGSSPAPRSVAVGSTPLRQANAAYREMKQTYGEGAVGDILAKTGRGQPNLSNAEVAAKVFHARPTAGEDAKAYLKATGPEGAPALADAAAYSLHEAATRPDGTFDPARATKWIDDHKLALDQLPSEVRSKFADSAKAQQAVGEALTKQRDALASFDKSEAGKIAGLNQDGDIVKHVGSIIDSKTAPEGRLAQLAEGRQGQSSGARRPETRCHRACFRQVPA